MKIKLLVLIMGSLFLIGCDAGVHSYELVGYEEACREKGGVAYINNMRTQARCNDGQWVSWTKK